MDSEDTRAWSSAMRRSEPAASTSAQALGTGNSGTAPLGLSR